MKKYTYRALVAIFVCFGVGVPHASYALSCLDPTSMIEHYVSSEDSTIFLAVAGETKEYVLESAKSSGLDPNTQFDSGYTGQYVEVREVYKGNIPDRLWVYFQKDATWNYLCAGAPPSVGEETLYVINQGSGAFALPQVVTTYPADGTQAHEIVTAIGEADDDMSLVDTMSATDWQETLRREIMHMIFLVSVKLGELRFWLTQ